MLNIENPLSKLLKDILWLNGRGLANKLLVQKEKKRVGFFAEMQRKYPDWSKKQSSTKSSIELNNPEDVVFIFNLAVKHRADLVTVDDCTTLFRHNSEEPKANEQPLTVEALLRRQGEPL